MFCKHKYENSAKCAIKKVDSSKTKAKPNQTSKLGQNTSTTEAQDQPGAHTPKAVARRVAQGTAAPLVRPHRP